MDLARILGIGGFVLVMGPFGFGLAKTMVKPTPATSLTEQVAQPTNPVRVPPEYVPYNLPITTTLPQFSRSVSVQVSFMLNKGDPIIGPLMDQIANGEGRIEAVLVDAVIEAANTAPTKENLRALIPVMMRHALNVQLGTDDHPTPIREVLITSYALQ